MKRTVKSVGIEWLKSKEGKIDPRTLRDYQMNCETRIFPILGDKPIANIRTNDITDIINKMWEEYELTPNNTDGIEMAKNPQEVQKQVNSIRTEIKELGSINVDAINEYKEIKERYDFMCEQRLDLEDSSNKLKKVIEEMTETVKIGSDLETDGLIRSARISEALSVLKMYKTICDVARVSNIISVASAKIKELKNHRSFFDEIYNTCGFRFKVLTEEEELSALYTGVINTLDVPKAVIVEVCDGCTNLVHYNRRNILNQVSIPVGAYTLTKLVQAGADPEKTCQKMVDVIKAELKNVEWLNDINVEFSFVGAGNAFANASFCE